MAEFSYHRLEAHLRTEALKASPLAEDPLVITDKQLAAATGTAAGRSSAASSA
jgi:hypothetical protein